MDIQQYVDQMVAIKRQERMRDSIQLTLGQLIAELEKYNPKHGTPPQDTMVSFDFGSAVPTELASWRGSYAELALGYRLSGYDAPRQGEDHFNRSTVATLLENLKGAVGKEFTGWKGGEFLMDNNTPVWVANEGNADNTGIIGVLDKGYELILLTAYCEY